MSKLNQVIAVEKGVKNRVAAVLDGLYKAIQKPALFDGFIKTYQRKDEGSEQIPPQTQRVQFKSEDVITQVGRALEDLFDITAQKDFANCSAKSDVVVDGETLLKEVPTTFLLFLEKQLTDLSTVLGKLPTLDPAESWDWDNASAVYKAEPTKTTRTAKVQKALVLYPHSEKHPAQTQLITEDVVVGTWDQLKMSGAVSEQRRADLVARVEKLHKAVKFAREEANLVDAPTQNAGTKLVGWLLKA